jgi:ferredoxin-NADP reductase
MPSAPEPASRLLDVRAAWNAEEDDLLVCRAVRDETHDVRTFVLASREPRRFAYNPGQFLTFAFEIAGETVHRCYTLASAPTRPDTVAITVKRVPGGPVSNWLHDNIMVGASVRALGPMGEFSCFARPHPVVEPRYLFLSGGSGITPLMSMARTFHDLAVPRDIVFVHNARSPSDVVFRRELVLMARSSAAFRFVPVCERDVPHDAWMGHRGRLSSPMLELIAADFREREVFVCGPSPYMAAVRDILQGASFDMARHHEESFDFAELSRAEQSQALGAEAELDAKPLVAPVRTFRIEFAKTSRAIDCPEDTFVLAAARKAGIRLPSSCTKGMCGTCKSRILSGTVTMTHAGGIRQREIDAGMALLCCSKPTSDLVVER